jgi:hypothetical protein
MIGQDRDDQCRGMDVMESGLGMPYAVVACEDGYYCVRFETPTGRSVIVGKFISEEDAKAWIGPMTTVPEDS